ncbi:DUF987 family protein [Escherichia coli]|nr:DUF987 family protein [Escherichia coli]EEV3706670.1 DUF987 family protein [Escherichia coli]EFL2003889.1 DUF987 family protein [Escherichia coli]
MRLASRFGRINQIRRDRPLTHEELMHYVPSIFGEDRHTSRSERYSYIPTITVLESLQREGFQPFFACQTRVRDPGRRGYTKHMLRLRRDGEINGQHVPEIILLNSHDGTSSYQMLPGYFRFVCQNGCVCGQSLGEVRVPHRGNVVDRVIEGAYEVVGVFDRIEEKRDAMQSLVLPPPARQALAQAALTYRYGDEHQPVTTADILTPRRREDYGKDLWSAYQTIQENMLKGGLSGRSAKGKRIHTRGEAMRIHQQHPASRLFPFCTGKYRWHGSAKAYTGREVQNIPGVLAVFAERRKDSFGPYVRLMSVTLN